MHYRQQTILLIIIAAILKIVVANCIELGNDEVYYRLFAKPIQWNYFDHPPMVGWLIRLSTFNLLIDNTFTVRLGAIICGSIAIWLIFLCGTLIKNSRTGFYAAYIYTASLYGSIISGTFILPDSPQMVFWIASLLMLLKIVTGKQKFNNQTKYILLFGLFTGLGMLCKIHTSFLWFGFGIYVLLFDRGLLAKWSIYLAALITVVCFMPVIVWNFQHNFVTYTYHSKRVDVLSGGLHLSTLLTFILGQILYCNPIVFFLISKAIIKQQSIIKLSYQRILLLTGLPLIIVAVCISIFKEVLPHWTGPAFSSLILLTAAFFSSKNITVPFTFKAAMALTFLIVTVSIIGINFYPGTIGKKDKTKLGDGDFTLDMYGWKKFSKGFDSIYYSTHKSSQSNTVILADKWFPAAHIDYYVAKHLGINTIVEGPLEDIHQYNWLNKKPTNKDSVDVYVISPSNYLVNTDKFKMLNNINPNKIDTIIQNRNKNPARKFYVLYYRKGLYNF